MFQRAIRWKGFIIIVLLLELVVLMQIKFTAWPEMTLWPYLMLKGWLPYKDIAIAHNPLLLVILAFFYRIVGLGLTQLKLFTWGLILISGLVTFWITKRLWNLKVAALSLVFWVPLTIYYDANGLWFDLALVPFYLVTYYFSKTGKFKLAGFFWVFSFLVKQTAVFILIPIFIDLYGKNIIKNLESFLFGVFVIFIPFLLIVWVDGIMPDYVYWTFSFAGSKLPFSEGQIIFPSIRQLILGGWPLVVALCVIFVKDKKRYFNLILWAIFAGLGVYPRWELFHILPSIPFFAIIFSFLLVDTIKAEKQQKYVVWFGILLFLLLSVKKIAVSWHLPVRFYEKDVVLSSQFIRENTSENEPVFILNFWDHVYALSGTLPATRPWVPQFSWYMNYPGVQEKVLSDLMLNSPKYVIYHPYSETGLDSYRPKVVADYVERYYQPIRFYEDFEILEKR